MKNHKQQLYFFYFCKSIDNVLRYVLCIYKILILGLKIKIERFPKIFTENNKNSNHNNFIPRAQFPLVKCLQLSRLCL